MVIVVPIKFDAPALQLLGRATFQWQQQAHRESTAALEAIVVPKAYSLFQHFIFAHLLADVAREVITWEHIRYTYQGQKILVTNPDANRFIDSLRYPSAEDAQNMQDPRLALIGEEAVQPWLRQHIPMDVVTLQGSLSLLWYACVFELIDSHNHHWLPERDDNWWQTLTAAALRTPAEPTASKVTGTTSKVLPGTANRRRLT